MHTLRGFQLPQEISARLKLQNGLAVAVGGDLVQLLAGGGIVDAEHRAGKGLTALGFLDDQERSGCGCLLPVGDSDLLGFV